MIVPEQFSFIPILKSVRDLDRALAYWSQQDLAATPVDIYQPFTRGSRTNQTLAGALYGKVQRTAPGDGHISIDFQYIIVEGDLHQFLLGARGLQAEDPVALNPQVEEPFVAQRCRGEVGTGNSLMFQ